MPGNPLDSYNPWEEEGLDAHFRPRYAWFAMPDPKTPVWVTAVGDHIPVSKMEDSHINNVILFLQRKDPGEAVTAWIKVFEKELEDRKPPEVTGRRITVRRVDGAATSAAAVPHTLTPTELITRLRALRDAKP